jgi:hypothetical protein
MLTKERRTRVVYEVRRIKDEDLEGHDWAMVQDGDRVTLFVKDEVAGDLEAHAQAWAAFRLLDQSDASSPLRLVRSGG